MRAMLIPAFLFLTASSWAPINLDRPGVLEAIEKEDPAHHARIVEITTAAGEVSCETLPQLFKARYQAVVASCTSLLVLTSYPAKRHLAFELDGRSYVTNLVLTGTQPLLTPAR